jgi:hypothetical protein
LVGQSETVLLKVKKVEYLFGFRLVGDNEFCYERIGGLKFCSGNHEIVNDLIGSRFGCRIARDECE